MRDQRYFAFLMLLVTSQAIAKPSPTPPSMTSRPHPPQLVVVIDPGHGGTDTGAIYKLTQKDKSETYTEKTLTLLIARDLARERISRGNQVVLTRNEDKEISLTDRTALANRLKADIFISIHLNSTSELQGAAHGIETYILNHATDASSRRLADLENSVLKESQAKEKGASSNISLIMKDMILDANLIPSKALACAVQNKLKMGSKNRGVRQALFYVLLGTDMPSILIEAGFLNNKEDRERALNSDSRQKMVNRIAAAIEDYRLKKSSTQCHVL